MPKKSNLYEFIEQSKLLFKDLLIYDKVIYVNNATPVTLKCNKNHEFKITPNAHLSYKRWCKICGGSQYDKQFFIEKAKSINGDEFEYSFIHFRGVKNNILIRCKKHGLFKQTPDKHINSKQKCPKCDISCKKDQKYFLLKSNEIHNGKYFYELSIFTRMFDKLIITCPIHGDFKQTPANHINHKQGCRQCSIAKSKKEIAWLNLINLPNDKIHRSVRIYINENKYFIVDGFNPLTKTIYEFYGNYWHGNLNMYDPIKINQKSGFTFQELYDKTILRENLLKSAGYNLITMWEQDYDLNIKNNNKQIGKS